MQATRYLKHIDTLVAAIAGFYAIHLFSAYSGIGISPDSIMYVSTARNIHEHGSLLTFNGGPLVFFPVFYPAFLSISLIIFQADPVAYGGLINGLLFAAVIFVSGLLISRFKAKSIIYKWLILAAIVLSPAMLEIYSFLWSETLFVLTILLFILAFKQYLQKHSWPALLLAALVAAICCITRYAGITIIATGGLMILADGTLPFRKRMLHGLTFGIASSCLLAVNLIVNSLSSGLATGTREPSITPFSENLHYFGTVLCDWLGLTNVVYPFASGLAVFILVGLIAGLVINSLKNRLNSYESVITFFAVVYGLFILIIATVSRFERVNSRLLSPMFITLLIACTYWVPNVIRKIKKRGAYWLASGASVIIMCGYLYNIYHIDRQRYDDEFEYGIPGYSDDDWNKSAFVTFLKTHRNIFKPGVTIYSDADEALYFFGGITGAKLLPHRFFKADVAKFYSEKHYYLVWFKKLGNAEIINIKDIEQKKHLTKLYDLEDGAIYEYRQ
ncbi:hypothetical protein GCM10023149_17790 [Mucilaginibacter gynuensis]|uniref:Dolichyl-phosphate-mannose-protein mannosyltransferase n=1 Tax=Mucilaginibacter gynuensis TaxID=1302236 RepID=A0ABP8G7V6_9SPHI